MARNNIFNSVMAANRVPGSNFDLSHQHKTTFDIGELVPTCQIECMPGDKFTIGTEIFARMAPMIAPIFHNLDVTVHYFFVPNRILWPLWEDWMTGKTEVAHPVVDFGIGDVGTKDLGEYLGYRNNNVLEQNAFPGAAYALIYDEYYRAQHIQTTEQFTDLQSGPNNTWLENLLKAPCLHRAWPHDYFTSCLPFPQVSDAVELPILSQDAIDVTLKELSPNVPSGDQEVRLNSTGALATSVDVQSDGSGILSDGTNDIYIHPQGTLEVDFTGIIPNINDLREALALQRWLELEARAGQRYIEHNLAFFGVHSSNKALNRPEYICGHKQQMVVSEVLTTGEATGNPVGNMQGHGISVGGKRGKKYFCEEHGWIIGITSVLPKSGYYQGCHRTLSHRIDRYDYPNPKFAKLGEQEVYQKEVYLENADTQATLDTVFGYVPRFAEAKHLNNVVSGEFRNTLEFWHMDRKFSSAPALNATFIECVEDKRGFASITGDNTIYALIQNNVYVNRKLPKYGIPAII